MSKHQKESASDWKKVGACLYRYKNGIYYALFKRRGKQIRVSLETADLELARRKLTEKRKDLETTDPKLARRNLEEHSERFLAAIKGAESTKANIKRCIKKLTEEWPSGQPTILAKIKKGDCNIWLRKYSSLKPASVNQIITTARGFFDLAVEDGVIPRSPMDGIKFLKRGSVTRVTPTPEQFEAIVADIRSQPSNGHGSDNSADFVALAGLLGLGQAELSAIERQHINMDSGSIQILRRKTQVAFTIPIYPLARPVIERRMGAMPSDQSARLLPYDDCKKGLAGACRRLGFPAFEPRSLRRFFITRALRIGVDVPTVAKWQGHKDGGALILRTYGDVVGEPHSHKMAALLGPTPENVILMKEAV